MYYVYILKSKKTKRLYVGCTRVLKERLIRHNSGSVQSTKSGVPWDLVYYEGHLSMQLARSAELYYKTGQGRRQVRKKLGLAKDYNKERCQSG